MELPKRSFLLLLARIVDRYRAIVIQSDVDPNGRGKRVESRESRTIMMREAIIGEPKGEEVDLILVRGVMNHRTPHRERKGRNIKEMT